MISAAKELAHPPPGLALARFGSLASFLVFATIMDEAADLPGALFRDPLSDPGRLDESKFDDSTGLRRAIANAAVKSPSLHIGSWPGKGARWSAMVLRLAERLDVPHDRDWRREVRL